MDKNIDDKEKARASAWFTELRNQICKSFEFLERNQTSGPFANLKPGKFEQKVTRRNSESENDAGGGIMSVMREGRLFEKVGVNISTVYGQLGEAAQKSISARRNVPGLKDDSRFWASGISLVAHMRSPKNPAVHMNTRMFWTPKDWWFGGGTDLNPIISNSEDTTFFHAELKKACDIHNKTYYPKYKDWADDYFMIKHWNEPRGVGGIFYDDHCTEDWEADFAFTKDVGLSFLNAFVPITRRRCNETWCEEDRELQLIKRGRYTEFNLVYDRGTQFGLQTGHNPEAVLMSLPPIAKWP
ncbi:MAG: oxygen-dependent coproporphyrinogen oxidase [Paracoccaceae bacterium]|nr:oxygen-dependent coproporphyrinogen oxidase [Paracoccaceae bacterium]